MTSPGNQRAGHDPLGRALYDIAHTLESADRSPERMLRVLQLLGTIVPYDHCALLHVQAGREPRLVAVPAASPAETTRLTDRLLELFGLLAADNAHQPTTRRSVPGRLAVPLVSLDEVIGVLEVRDAADAYSISHLRALSVVAAQLAAHLTMLQARAVDADRARELDEARRAAEAANRAKDEFLALVSHELKSPLSSTLAWAHSLGSGDLDPGARAHAVDGIERGVRAQARLIDEILDLAGIASAALRLDLRAIDPARRIRAAIERLQLEAEARAIRLEAVLDPSVTPLVVDPDRFDQIISNLVASSLAHTPSGGRVDVLLERAGDHARIRVTDTGTEIAAEALPRVFDSFRPRRDDSRPTGGGIGVGLTIVKKLVELHGGSVNAESGGDQAGATFTIELPLVPEVRALAGLRVLLVDDDQDFRDALRAVLEARGAEVTAVDSVAAALAALERCKPDVLLSELAMPRESGYDLLRAVAARGARLPAAALTRFGSADESTRAVAAGFRMHLSKPIEVEALVSAVADLAGRPLARRARSAGTR